MDWKPWVGKRGRADRPRGRSQCELDQLNGVRGALVGACMAALFFMCLLCAGLIAEVLQKAAGRYFLPRRHCDVVKFVLLTYF